MARLKRTIRKQMIFYYFLNIITFFSDFCEVHSYEQALSPYTSVLA